MNVSSSAGPPSSSSGDPSDDDPDQDLAAHLLVEIEAGRLSLEEAVARHPHLERALRQVESIRNFLKTAQAAPGPDAPRNLGEYTIVGVVGRGGMGVVYRARHERLGREVAVKTVHPAHVSPQARERFLREQKALAQLHQTHIVPIYAAGGDGETEYFVMPYIEGASLARVLDALRRGDARAASKSDTLYSLVKSTARFATEDRSTSVFSQNGARSASRQSAMRQEVSVADAEPAPPAEPPTSTAYFRSAAEIIAHAAEAIDHAHRRGVVHRDLKPNNIMLAADARLWVIDFGLAAFLPREQAESGPPLVGDPLLTQAAVGTLTYMAPEQFDLQTPPDARTDVWGLGVTLYEMLTLRRAFAHRSSSQWKEAADAPPPPHPADAAPALPPDVAAICWKAMRPEPAQRYQTAAALAEDLRRWLRDEPVSARKRPLREQARRWVDRHRSWAALIGVLLAAVPTIVGLQYRATTEARVTLAERERQLVVRDLEAALHADRIPGWSATALAKIREAAAVRKDATLEDAALAASAGPDAELVVRHEAFGASSAAYDLAGKRLVLGGVAARRNRAASPAMVWDLTDPAPTPGKAEGPGLVAFQGDGTPVQLVAVKSGRLRLLHVMTGATMKEFGFPSAAPRVASPVVALSKRGEHVAASFTDEGETFLWTERGGRTRLPVGASALAFSRDGSIVALGAASGETSVWSTGDGKQLAAFRVAPLAVQALAFSGRAGLYGASLEGEIAVGAYGRCGIVDLATRQPNCFLETTEHTVTTLEFAPDDALVAADGTLFDAATGRRVLQLALQLGVFAFSPDGTEACQAAAVGFSRPQVARYALKSNRGVSLLHGLRTPAARLAMSKDGRMIAALSRDWRLAVWEAETGRLVRLLDLPEGPFADNAAVALDESGGRLAAASGKSAVLWDVRDGKRLREWTLPPAFSNEIAFAPSGELILVRSELKSMSNYPSRTFSASEHPRALRGRNLLSKTPTQPLYEVDAFRAHCYGIALTPDGARFLADGLTPTPANPQGERSARLFDARTGREVGRYALGHAHDFRSARTDPTGAVMAFNVDDNADKVRFVRASDGAPLDVVRAYGVTLGPNGDVWSGVALESVRQTHCVFQRGRDESVHRLAHFAVGRNALFSADGRRFVFETTSGAVGVVDLPLVEQNLRDLGLR